MKRISLFVLFSALFTINVYAGEYSGLTPGVSTKNDAQKSLGRPLAVLEDGRRLDYSPEEHDLKRLSVVFKADGLTIQSIDLFFLKPYSKTQIQEWFALKGKSETSYDIDGHRSEYYPASGLKLYYRGADEKDGIAVLSHVDNMPKKNNPISEKPVVTTDSCPAAAEKFARQADPFIEKDQYHQAIEPLKKASLCDPNSVLYASMLAFSYFNDGQEEQAIAAAKKALTIKDDYTAYSVLGTIYARRNACTEAIPYLEKAVSFPQDQPLQDNMEFLGVCYYKEVQLDKALDTLVKSYKRNKKSPLSVYFLAVTSDRLGEQADAKFFYKKFLRLRHNNKEMNAKAKERLNVLNKEQAASTREKTSRATQEIIKTIFGND